jgi:hypothetical protein
MYIQTNDFNKTIHKVILKGNKDGVPHYLAETSKGGRFWIPHYETVVLSKEETIKLSLKGEL